MLPAQLVISPYPAFLVLALCAGVTEGAVYRTASIGGAGGISFDDFTSVLGSLPTTDYRPHNILLWQECLNGGLCNVGAGFTGFEPSHAICEDYNCYITFGRKTVIFNWPSNDATSQAFLAHGDFVEMMYGYIKIGEGTLDGLYLLNGVGIVVRRRGAGGITEEIFAGYREGLYMEILGPLVAFWGGYGGAFDQLGAYMDPSVWPERPSRMVIREMHGVTTGGASTDAYFSSVTGSGSPYAMRLVSATVYYTDTSIMDLVGVFQNDLGEPVERNVGTGGTFTQQTTINVTTGAASIGHIQIQQGGSGCLSGIVVQLVYSDGTPPVDMVFGSTPTSPYTTEGQIVGFHGIAGENCIRRLGVYTLLDSSELKDTCQLPSLSRVADNVTLALESDLPERILNGTVITFACNEGYYLAQGGVMTCGDDGIWQGYPPECVPIPDLPSSSTIVPMMTVTSTVTETEDPVTLTEMSTVTTTEISTTTTTKTLDPVTLTELSTETITESSTVTESLTVTTTVTTGNSGLPVGAPASVVWSSCQTFLIPFIVVLGASLILLLILILVLGILCAKLRTKRGFEHYATSPGPMADLDVAMENPLFMDDGAKPPMGYDVGTEAQEMRLHISETDVQKELVAGN